MSFPEVFTILLNEQAKMEQMKLEMEQLKRENENLKHQISQSEISKMINQISKINLIPNITFNYKAFFTLEEQHEYSMWMNNSSLIKDLCAKHNSIDIKVIKKLHYSKYELVDGEQPRGYRHFNITIGNTRYHIYMMNKIKNGIKTEYFRVAHATNIETHYPSTYYKNTV